MKAPLSLLLIDGAALLVGAGGVTLMARRAPSPDAAYRRRIAGAMLLAIALFASGFATASWVAA